MIADHLRKRNNFPLARVLDVEINRKGEATKATLRKGGSRETVVRHVSALVPYLRPDHESTAPAATPAENEVLPKAQRPSRKAAVESRRKTAKIFS